MQTPTNLTGGELGLVGGMLTLALVMAGVLKDVIVHKMRNGNEERQTQAISGLGREAIDTMKELGGELRDLRELMHARALRDEERTRQAADSVIHRIASAESAILNQMRRTKND